MNLHKSVPLSILLPAVAASISGCASGNPYGHSDSTAGHESVPTVQATGSDARTAGHKVADTARAMIGIDYVYGGEGPASGFDCSGLVYYSYRQIGMTVPRRSEDQFKLAKKISLHELVEGDLIFFQDQVKLSHVGIYVGDGLFIHAPSSGKSVSISDLSAPYYQRHLVAAGRLLPDGR